MSSILDALNKADQRRKQQKTSTPTASLPINAPIPANNNTLLLVGLALAATMLLLWLWSSSAAQIWSTSAVGHGLVDQVQPIPQPTTPETATMTAEVVQLEKNISAEAAPLLEAASGHPRSLPPLSALPSKLLASLPAINIAAHTYAQDVAKRMVIINSKVLHEHRYISPALLLREITPSGVVLEYQGFAFSMTAFDTWPY